MQSLQEIVRMVIIDRVINTLLGRLTLDPAGMHCPSWDDAFVSSLVFVSTTATFHHFLLH